MIFCPRRDRSLRPLFVLACSTLGALAYAPGDAHAQLAMRYHTSLRGNMTVIGNTLAQNTAGDVPPPLVGTIGQTGANTGDAGADVFWQSNTPAVGGATADVSITAAEARSQGSLILAPGSVVRYARLYWAATGSGPAADTEVEVSRVGAFTSTVVADSSIAIAGNRYQSSADVTSLVQQWGQGSYQIGGVDCVALPDLHSDGAFAAWSMVIVYENLSEVPREVLIADGLHLVAQTSPLSHAFTLGSPVLNINRSGQLAVLCYQGDDGVSGDTIQASSSPLSNMMNPANNFANGSRTFLGVSVAFPADLPRLIGSARSMSGFDLDTFDLTAFINPGQLVIPVQCSTTNDEYLVGMIAVSASVETTCETFTIAEHPQSQARCPGSSVQFTVGTDASNPQYRWHKNGVDLEDGRGFTGSGTNTLTIEGILAGDAGDYRCRVSTLCQISNSEPATLTVEVCCPGDFDGNGLLAVSDIFAFLSAWFAGCP